MKSLNGTFVPMMIAAMLMQSAVVEGAGLGKAVARGATKSASKALNKGLVQKLRRDLLRDRKTRVRVLPRDRHVFRYTTKQRAQEELRKGIRPGTHMTSRATPGRPPSALRAQRTYGLRQKPQVREKIHLPRGLPVKFNRVLGGKRGKGEISSTVRLPRQTIEGVVPMK